MTVSERYYKENNAEKKVLVTLAIGLSRTNDSIEKPLIDLENDPVWSSQKASIVKPTRKQHLIPEIERRQKILDPSKEVSALMLLLVSSVYCGTQKSLSFNILQQPRPR